MFLMMYTYITKNHDYSFVFINKYKCANEKFMKNFDYYVLDQEKDYSFYKFTK